MKATGVVADVKQYLYHNEPDVGATHFGFAAQVLIGTSDSDSSDSFDCILFSPSMFAERFSVPEWGAGFAEDVLPGGHVLPVYGVWLMKDWSRGAFEGAVEQLIAAMSPGPDWPTVATRIGRHLPWEYDYKHDDELNRRAGLPRLSRSFWHDDYRA